MVSVRNKEVETVEKDWQSESIDEDSKEDGSRDFICVCLLYCLITHRPLLTTLVLRTEQDCQGQDR